MFKEQTVAEMFKHQLPYSISSIKKLFGKVVNTSSSICLDERSIGKLFDLMFMGFRYQVMQCCQPSEFFHVTMKHLEELRKTIVVDAQTEALIKATENRLIEMCSTYKNYDF